MNGYVRVNEESGSASVTSDRSAAGRVRAASWLTAVLLTCIAIATASAQGDTAQQARTAAAAWDAQREYQESRVAAWRAAHDAAALREAAEAQAIVRAQREYQTSRALAWWRTRDTSAVSLCTVQPREASAPREDGGGHAGP